MDKKYYRVCSSVLHVPSLGYFFVLHMDHEDPLELLMHKKTNNFGGPFDSEDDAKANGTRALNHVQDTMRKRGLKAFRPAKA